MNLTITPSDRARAAYRYLWMRTVVGFDDRHHCVRCLKGQRVPRVRLDVLGAKVRTEVDVVCPHAPFVYLCAGASGRYGYERNVHIALREAPGRSTYVVGYDGTVFHVAGAERLVIPDLADGWEGLAPAFTRCRNFRFGVAAFGWRGAPPGPLLVDG